MYGSSIYIFDDDQDILLMCGIVLRQQGYQVFTCQDCNDIVDKVTKVNPDLIIMDNKIPPDGGTGATQVLKSNPATRDIPVLFFSANLKVEQLSKEAGAEEYIQKPFDLSEFETVIERLIRKKINGTSN